MLNFNTLCAWLMSLTSPASTTGLRSALRRLSLQPGDLAPWIRFDSAGYRRNAVVENQHFQMLVICWCHGQRSPIHDHAGSACAVRVISGIASETLYDVTDPVRPRPTATSHLIPGKVTASFDRDAHRITAATGNLVTLHVYSPVLRTMTLFPDESSNMYRAPRRAAAPAEETRLANNRDAFLPSRMK